MRTDLFIKFLNCKFSDFSKIEKCIVFSFIKCNNIDYIKSKFLKDYFINEEIAFFKDVYNEYFNKKMLFDFENIVELFEFQIPAKLKKQKGVVFTPKEIREYIVAETLVNTKNPQTVIDPACGSGSFLLTVIQKMVKMYNLSYSEIINKYIFGIDVNPIVIEQAKLLLSLLAAINNDYNDLTFNLFCKDAINPATIIEILDRMPTGFDVVIGNPPYVRYKNIEDSEKEYLLKWESSSIGNVDLFIPFFELGDKLLSDKGKLGYISPNSFLQGKNCTELRKFLSKSKTSIKIIDFRDSQIFKNVTCYTAITIMEKQKNNCDSFLYTRVNVLSLINNCVFTVYHFSDFPNGIPWRLRDKEIDENIYKIENAGTKLGTWKIRNGLATLKNDLFFFTPEKEDVNFYYRIFNDIEYPIEKNICIKVVKPNIIKNEADLVNLTEIAIFPYMKTGEKYAVLEENYFKTQYPKAYSFLVANKTLLLKRDKGEGKYPAWYSYGRTQGLTNFGKKLLIPYISGKPTAVISLDEQLLFYCGYALFSDDEEELRLLKIFLESEVFWYYIYNTSKPYSKGYMAFAKNYIVNFGIPELSSSERQYLLTCNSMKLANTFIWEKYKITKKTYYYFLHTQH